MTPDELRSLADEAEHSTVASIGVARIFALAPDLARLCAEMGEALALVGDYSFGTWDDDAVRLAAGRKGEGLTRAALAKLSKLESVT